MDFGDVDLAAEKRKIYQPVVLGTECYLPDFALSDEHRRQKSVQWTQGGDRSDEYALVMFAYRAKDKKSMLDGRLFISTKKLAEFRKLTTEYRNENSKNNWRSFVVSNDFQYGQVDAKETGRFLVLHDKSQKLYQHRFVNSRWVKAGTLSFDLLNRAGFGSKDGLDFAAQQSKSVVGDYLKNFDGTVVTGGGLDELFAVFSGSK